MTSIAISGGRNAWLVNYAERYPRAGLHLGTSITEEPFFLVNQRMNKS